ncbi:MAG: leucyl aminopeptidase [SAR324 cluster bacterium]|nr:leucyl aminopeptidase [SAR324 cluster bacterium]
MEIKLDYKTKGLESLKTDALILMIPEIKKNKEIGKQLDFLPDSLIHLVKQAIKLKVFSEKAESTHLMVTGIDDMPRLLLVGTGKQDKLNQETLRRIAGKIGKKIKSLKSEAISLVLPPWLSELSLDVGTIIAEGLLLGAYDFNKYSSAPTPDEEDDQPVDKVKITLLDADKMTSAKAIKQGETRAIATNYARDLGNTPGNDLYPEILAKEAESIALEYNMKIRILDQPEMEELGMGMLLGVARGSVRPPKLILMEYQHPKAKKQLAIVGKGVTFDSGGISLKPGSGMDEMKYDMCGAAAILGAMKAIGELKPKLNIIGVIPAVENMPDGNAQRPGDIVTAFNGKRVEVLNTDAEGRLILGDALSYTIKEYSPDGIIDFATLTGACIIALGHYASGVISNNEELTRQVVEAGKSSGDTVWPLPSFPEYEESIKGKFGDLLNTGGREAGTITAGLFLKNFVEEIPWVHVDIAGTAWGVKHISYQPAKGTTGVGVRLLIDLIGSWQA